jgi:predicted SnoaL-like aldol condensation-catalyzing enzyme
MTEEHNKAVFRRYLEIWRTGNVSEIDAIIGGGYIGHAAAGDRDRQELAARVQAFQILFPDVVFTIEDQIAVSDKVITRITARGTHQLSGKATTLIGINISRIHEGRIVEEWPVWERLSDSYSDYQ